MLGTKIGFVWPPHVQQCPTMPNNVGMFDAVIEKRQNLKSTMIRLHKNADTAARKVMILFFLRYSSRTFVFKICWMEKA